MFTNKIVSLLAFVLLQQCNFIVEGCSCRFPQPSLKQLFCEADYVIKARIISETQEGSLLFGDNRYGIKLKKVFRTTPMYDSAVKTDVWSADNSAACGTRLLVGKTYLLAGFVHQSKLRISSCQWHQGWKTLGHKTKHNVKSVFQKEGTCDKFDRLNLPGR